MHTNTSTETMRLLTAAIESKGELPCLSASLSRIVDSMHGEGADDEQLASVVLSDFALTQKVLRLANSPMYSAFGSVTTISMAIYVLGTEAVGHLAMGLKLLDNLGIAADGDQARDELSKAVTSGAVARSVAADVSAKDGEAVAVAALMRCLGKLMVCFYLPEQHAAIQLVDSGIEEEDAAAFGVLGLSYSDIAVRMARTWKLPAELSARARPPAAGATAHELWVDAVATYSRTYVEAVVNGATADELSALAERYADGVGATPERMLLTAGAAVDVAKADGGTADLWDRRKADGRKEEPLAKLKAGVDELERAEHSLPLPQIVGMATEILWNGLNCRNAMFFMRFANRGVYEHILGRGEHAADLVRKVSFEEAFSPNVVHLALARGKPVFLGNPQDPAMQRRIPDWTREHLPPSGALFLAPFIVQGKAGALMYLEWPPGVRGAFSPEEHAQLERLIAIVSGVLERFVAAARSRTPVAA